MTVEEILNKLKDWQALERLTPQETAQYQVFLSSYLWDAGVKVIENEQKSNAKWNEIRQVQAKTDKIADKLTSQTTEWREWQLARIYEKQIIECIRSLKKLIQVFNEQQKNQY